MELTPDQRDTALSVVRGIHQGTWNPTEAMKHEIAKILNVALLGEKKLLTGPEHDAMKLTAELTNLVMRDVIGDEASRAGDVAEFVGMIHAIQHFIMAQAAARAYPSLYRLLGSKIEDRDPVEEEGWLE